jgi:hypothetical protein
MDEDIPLAFALPAAVVKYALSRLQAVNDCFQAWASQPGKLAMSRFQPFSAVQPSRREWRFLPQAV